MCECLSFSVFLSSNRMGTPQFGSGANKQTFMWLKNLLEAGPLKEVSSLASEHVLV